MVGRRVFAKLPDGTKLIILNPTHGANRQNATLMEEISHVFSVINRRGLPSKTTTVKAKSSPAIITPKSKKKLIRSARRRSFRIPHCAVLFCKANLHAKSRGISTSAASWSNIV